MFYDFIYLAKGFRMRPKVRSTLNAKLKLNLSRAINGYAHQVFKGGDRHNNEVGTEVLVINDLLIYCRPQFVLSSTKLPNKHVFNFLLSV